MQDMLLLAAVAAAFVFGWFLAKRLDSFLESDRHAQKLRLRFCETEKESPKGLAAEKFNALFLPENAEIPAHMHYNYREENFTASAPAKRDAPAST